MSQTSRLVRAAAAFIVAGTVLAACAVPPGVLREGRHLQPLSPRILAELREKNMTAEAPIMMRIFKEEAELEVWKQEASGQYALFRTYPICRWSGELGPKIREGDRQAPEGFYNVSQAQMNPNSSFYLSFNLGYPNSFDRAHNRTGSHLMVHGDCSSAGCYAMTDEQMGEIWALARESFRGGQQAFQVQAFPFRMTAKNLARHRTNPHMAFWRNLKDGHDHFEVTRTPPKVAVCDRRYVFNADPADPNARMTPTGPCPELQVDPQVAQAVARLQQTREREKIVLAAVTPEAPHRTGRDGGMHPIFLARMEGGQRFQDREGATLFAGLPALPGTIPAHTRPPADPAPAAVQAPATPALAPAVAVAAAPAAPAPAPAATAAAAARTQPPATQLASSQARPVAVPPAPARDTLLASTAPAPRGPAPGQIAAAPAATAFAAPAIAPAPVPAPPSLERPAVTAVVPPPPAPASQQAPATVTTASTAPATGVAAPATPAAQSASAPAARGGISGWLGGTTVGRWLGLGGPSAQPASAPAPAPATPPASPSPRAESSSVQRSAQLPAEITRGPTMPGAVTPVQATAFAPVR